MDDQTANQLNQLENYLSFKPTWIFKRFIQAKNRILALFTGNQYGKTGGTAYQYVLRIMGEHPVPRKNVLFFECASRFCKNDHRHVGLPENSPCPDCGEELDEFSAHSYSIATRPEDNICTECGEKLSIRKRKTRIFRFCSENLPNDKSDTGNASDSAETKNTTYPAFKKWLPAMLIKKDITARNAAMTLHDPNAGRDFGDLHYEGGDIVVEFVSYSQQVGATAGVQRLSIWTDEEPPYEFYKEQVPRLLAENGDLIITLTPANYITWTYDDIFEKASIYYRSPAICDFLSQEGDRVDQIEKNDSGLNIAVFQAATDDNPTLTQSVINELFENFDDPDDIAIRRYGIFRQVSGRIFKEFEYGVHAISGDKHFPAGVPHDWTHGRGIDYHQQTPWACTNAAMSDKDEMFVWREFNPSPEKLTLKEIAYEFACRGEDYRFKVNLVDPLIQASKDGNRTLLDDWNAEIYDLSREGIGMGGRFMPWDTKGEKGREEIKLRLKNSKRVGRPFNNDVVEEGRTKRLPTIWFLDECKTMNKSMRLWRWDEWADATSKNTKEQKNKPAQKHSHFPMTIEALCKHTGFRAPAEKRHTDRQYNYFRRA
jgi:phage terminase large subunit-like protein